MKKNYLYIVLIALVLLALTSFFVFRNKYDANNMDIVEEKFDWSSLAYSRISFFNASLHRASINIPENWEGSYRLKEEDGEANFYFLKADGSAELMFKIKKVLAEKKGDDTVCIAGDTGFDFIIFDIATTGQSDMKDGLAYIKETLKCY